jgi:prepilin peptidase CpaA
MDLASPVTSAVWLMAAVVQIGSLLVAAVSDLSRRIIPDCACLALGIAGATARLTVSPLALAASIGLGLSIFLLLALLHSPGILGGGDIKLLAAATLSLSFPGVVRLLAVTALAGGVLALLHLALRRLPHPARLPAGSSWPRRLCAVERWRIRRGAPLPYGIAIACGGICAVLTSAGS